MTWGLPVRGTRILGIMGGGVLAAALVTGCGNPRPPQPLAPVATPAPAQGTRLRLPIASYELSYTAVVDCDLDCVVAGRGRPPHGHIALARHAGDRGLVPGLDEQVREFRRRFRAGR